MSFCKSFQAPRYGPPTARDNLFVFIQLSKPDVSDCIWRLVASQAIFEEGSGPKKYRKECQAGLLKCCIALERLGLPAFWSQQLQVLGPGYGSIIFSGLAHHDLALAVRNLPQLCRTVESRSWILLTVPWLVDRFGLSSSCRRFTLSRVAATSQFPKRTRHAHSRAWVRLLCRTNCRSCSDIGISGVQRFGSFRHLGGLLSRP